MTRTDADCTLQQTDSIEYTIIAVTVDNDATRQQHMDDATQCKQFNSMKKNTMKNNTMRCNTMQCNTAQCNAVQ